MTTDILTVEAVANVLQLHPKTVLRFIREGRLRATKVGKQYRIMRSDLRSLVGYDRRHVLDARVTSIVDIADADAVLVQRLSAVLLGAGKGKESSGAAMSIDIAHDPERNSAKVIIIASPADAATCLKLVSACLET